MDCIFTGFGDRDPWKTCIWLHFSKAYLGQMQSKSLQRRQNTVNMQVKRVGGPWRATGGPQRAASGPKMAAEGPRAARRHNGRGPRRPKDT